MTTRYERLSSRSRRLETVAAVAAAVFSVVMCQLAPGGPAGATPPATVAAHTDARPGEGESGGAADAGALPRSAPVHVRVPGTGIDADVVTSDETGAGLPVPPPGEAMEVGWDASGPAPGERGAALLVGHLDSEEGPAAFAGLGGLRDGARVVVGRADGRTARFEVYEVEEYGKGGLPEDLLLAGTPENAVPQLRLVARGGAWSKGRGDDVSVVASARTARG